MDKDYEYSFKDDIEIAKLNFQMTNNFNNINSIDNINDNKRFL